MGRRAGVLPVLARADQGGAARRLMRSAPIGFRRRFRFGLVVAVVARGGCAAWLFVRCRFLHLHLIGLLFWAHWALLLAHVFALGCRSPGAGGRTRVPVQGPVGTPLRPCCCARGGDFRGPPGERLVHDWARGDAARHMLPTDVSFIACLAAAVELFSQCRLNI